MLCWLQRAFLFEKCWGLRSSVDWGFDPACKSMLGEVSETLRALASSGYADPSLCLWLLLSGDLPMLSRAAQKSLLCFILENVWAPGVCAKWDG